MYCTMKCQWKQNVHVLYHGPINESESESESETIMVIRYDDGMTTVIHTGHMPALGHSIPLFQGSVFSGTHCILVIVILRDR